MNETSPFDERFRCCSHECSRPKYGERSSRAFYLAFLVALAGGFVLGIAQIFVSGFHSSVIAGVTGLIGGVLIGAAALATWKKLSERP